MAKQLSGVGQYPQRTEGKTREQLLTVRRSLVRRRRRGRKARRGRGRGVDGCWCLGKRRWRGFFEVDFFAVLCDRTAKRAARLGSSSFFIFSSGFICVFCCGCVQSSVGCTVRSGHSMEAKSLFSLHRALAQPVKMCMFDFPVTILDDLVSSDTAPGWLGVRVCVDAACVERNISAFIHTVYVSS